MPVRGQVFPSSGYQTIIDAYQAAATADPALGVWEHKIHNSLFLPGVLQSPGLTKEIIGTSWGRMAASADELLKRRTEFTNCGKKALARGTLKISAIVPEGVLGRSLRRTEARNYLLAMLERFGEGVELRAIPAEAGYYSGLEISWHILSSPGGGQQLVFAKTNEHTGSLLDFVQDGELLGDYSRLFAQLHKLAASPAATKSLIEAM